MKGGASRDRISGKHEDADCTVSLRGMFAGDPNLTVDKYLEGKQAEKELE